MRSILFFLIALGLSSCGGGSRSDSLRIGVDSTWYPLNFNNQQPYVNGFVEDFLIETAKSASIEFERVGANWDALFDGLKEKKYDAILSSLPPYSFNKAKYDFSKPILKLGPVLILAVKDEQNSLAQFNEGIIGFIAGDASEALLEPYPALLKRSFPSIPSMLDAVATGEITGALLDRIPALNYVADLYAGTLKVASEPLTDAGIRLIALKGRHEGLIRDFDRTLKKLKQQKRLQTILSKWNLTVKS